MRLFRDIIKSLALCEASSKEDDDDVVDPRAAVQAGAMAGTVFQVKDTHQSAQGLYSLLRTNLVSMAKATAALRGQFSDLDVMHVGPPFYGAHGVEFDVIYRNHEPKRFKIVFGHDRLVVSEVVWSGKDLNAITVPYSDPMKIIKSIFARIVMGSTPKKAAMAKLRNPPWLANLKRIGHYDFLR